MRVLSSPTEVQSNQPISILITLLKYISLMSLICLAADVTHREICQFVKRVGYSQIASGLLLLDIKASRAAEGLLLECFMGYVG